MPVDAVTTAHTLLGVIVPDLQSRAFQNPQNAVGDFFRVACIFIGVFVTGAAISEIRVSRAPVGADAEEQLRSVAYRLVLVSFLCFAVVAVGTEIEHLGDIVTWRLPLNGLGTSLAAVALHETRRLRAVRVLAVRKRAEEERKTLEGMATFLLEQEERAAAGHATGADTND